VAGNYKKIGSLRIRRSGRAGEFLTGPVVSDVRLKAGARIFVFRNDRRYGEDPPDYYLYVSEDGLEQSGGSGPEFI